VRAGYSGRRPASAVDAGNGAAAAPGASAGRPLDPTISEAILEATLDVLAETGYAKLSIEAVAQRAGVHRPAVYRRWPTKLDLVAAAISSIARAVPDPATGNTRDDLVELVSSIGNMLVRNPRARLTLMLVAEIAVDEELAALVDSRTVQPRRAMARTILERGIERGEIRPDLDMELVCDLIVGSLYTRALVGRARLHRTKAERYVDYVLDGLRT
jgi:AcrR family transcriptional regulator